MWFIANEREFDIELTDFMITNQNLSLSKSFIQNEAKFDIKLISALVIMKNLRLNKCCSEWNRTWY